jgi:hypothetical protein
MKATRTELDGGRDAVDKSPPRKRAHTRKNKREKERRTKHHSQSRETSTNNKGEFSLLVQSLKSFQK